MTIIRIVKFDTRHLTKMNMCNSYSYFQLQDQLKDVPSITYTYRQPRSSILILQPLEVTLDVKLDQRASSSDDGPDVKTQADDNNSLADSSSVDKILAKS